MGRGWWQVSARAFLASCARAIKTLIPNYRARAAFAYDTGTLKIHLCLQSIDLFTLESPEVHQVLRRDPFDTSTGRAAEDFGIEGIGCEWKHL